MGVKHINRRNTDTVRIGVLAHLCGRLCKVFVLSLIAQGCEDADMYGDPDTCYKMTWFYI